MAIFQAWTITHSKIASKIRRGTHTRILSTVDIIPHSTRTHIYIHIYTYIHDRGWAREVATAKNRDLYTYRQRKTWFGRHDGNGSDSYHGLTSDGRRRRRRGGGGGRRRRRKGGEGERRGTISTVAKARRGGITRRRLVCGPRSGFTHDPKPAQSQSSALRKRDEKREEGKKKKKKTKKKKKKKKEEDGEVGGKDKLARHCPNRGDSFFLLLLLLLFHLHTLDTVHLCASLCVACPSCSHVPHLIDKFS